MTIRYLAWAGSVLKNTLFLQGKATYINHTLDLTSTGGSCIGYARPLVSGPKDRLIQGLNPTVQWWVPKP